MKKPTGWMKTIHRGSTCHHVPAWRFTMSVNDNEFIHIDFDGKRVLAWRRGRPGSDWPVVVVANFSDFTTENPTSPQAKYVVDNWPATPIGRQWKEVTQDRIVPSAWVGQEPIYAWEAKVYTLV